jgi:hypothetical protein
MAKADLIVWGVIILLALFIVAGMGIAALCGKNVFLD